MELLSKARLAEAECHYEMGKLAAAQHLLNAAQEALLGPETLEAETGSCESRFPVQSAALTIFQARLAFQQCEESCRPSRANGLGWFSRPSHSGCAAGSKCGPRQT